SDKKYLWVSSESGLYRYNRKRWRHFEANENMPSSNISNIELNKKKAYICTDSGLVIYDNGIFILQNEDVGLPSMPIMGVAPLSNNTAWAVVDGDLYHFDGDMWKNYIEFQDVLDQTAESIYDNMKIFDNADEKSAFLDKFGSLNGDELTQTDPEPIDSNDKFGDISELIDSVGTVNALKIMQDSLANYEATQAKLDEPEELSNDSTQAGTDAPEKIGKTIRVPYTAGIPFEITAMKVDNKKNLWIGTEYGLLKFNGQKWKWYGYRNYVVEQEMTIDELALSLVNGEKRRADRLAVNIKEVNRLQSDILVAGQKIKTYANPGGSRIHDICPMGDKIYFGTEGGTIFYENGWSRFNDEGLGSTEVTRIAEVDNNMWFASNDKVLIRAAARSEIAFMVAKWLPQLADDMYYNYLSVVFNPKGWGTIGVSATFLTYGTIIRTNSSGEVEGDFSPFDFAATISYGTSLSKSLSGGISTKIIYSHLSRLGAGAEQGEGTATAIGFDLGLFYRINRKLA
ncbi:MAG: hypothetical protein GY855_08860, partial [candidate division Zixibacteria bacterium]|nr:hypothetical protein [candidate division Zixibacteria bacterium]